MKNLGLREDGKRNFGILYDGEELGRNYAGATPKQAAVKAARDLLNPAPDRDSVGEEYKDEIGVIENLGEDAQGLGNYRLHLYDVWTWEEEPVETPDWLDDLVPQADARKKDLRRYEPVTE